MSCEDAAGVDLPRILCRLLNDSKESRYNEELGICCPGWRKDSSADSQRDKEQVINHRLPQSSHQS